MRTVSRRILLLGTALAVLWVVAVAFVVTLGVRSVVADPSGPVPNPGHAWGDIQGHGDDADGVYVSTESDEAFEVRVNDARALRLEPNATSPNLIGGYSDNSVTAGAYGAAICGGGESGLANLVTDDLGTIGGGRNNQAGDNAGTTSDASIATVGGGINNEASGGASTVAGGGQNIASGGFATVGGGWVNTASADLSTVGAGASNTASDYAATVPGGQYNTASAISATVGGGQSNTASGIAATIGGGYANNATADNATIGGGLGNEAAADYATIAGGGRSVPGDLGTRNLVTDDYGTICGGGNNQAGDNAGTTTDATYATVGGGGTNTATAEYATVGGGYGNQATGTAATVGGGWDNIASATDATVGGGEVNQATGSLSTIAGGGHSTATVTYATVGGGFSNDATANSATIAGGYANTASQTYSTVGGGADNTASQMYSTVGGGFDNTASQMYSTVAGGHFNTASGVSASVGGGESNTAAGSYSFAAGRQAKANHQGTFVWADSTAADFASTTADQFLVRASGGVGIGTNSPGAGVMLDVAGGDIRTDEQLMSTVATGTPPLVVSSTTLVSNLNADLLDGQDSSAFAAAGHNHDSTYWSLTGNAGSHYLGTTDNNALELSVNNSRALRLEPDATSPNVIGGYSGNSVTTGVHGAAIGGGGASLNTNLVTDDYGTIGGGDNNQAGDNAGATTDATYATVGGGRGNQAAAQYATIAGGSLNDAGDYASVGGGSSNEATLSFATVAGGYDNTASQGQSTVGGGRTNTASGMNATVSGGITNTSSAAAATVGGGQYNTASWASATVGGGADNTASATAAIVGGGADNTASGSYATVGGGSLNDAAAHYATIAGGGESTPGNADTRNLVTDDYGTIGGGGNNQAGDNLGTSTDAIYATVGGGFNNTASSDYATVGGGPNNTASGMRATVGGGGDNTASAGNATVGGGYSNEATDINATIGGGWDNAASGQYATIPGGYDNTAAGNNSFAAGRQADAALNGCFVWGDSSATTVSCDSTNEFVVQAGGGLEFYSASDLSDWVNIYDDATDLITTSTGAHLTVGGVWTNASDASMKDNFTPVDGQAVLASLADVPITTWNHNAEDASITHMGPTAQDFYAAFGLGGSDTSIGTLDADGVALAAIQGLYEIVQEQDARIQALEADNAHLAQRLDDLEARVAALDGRAPASQGSESLLASMMPFGWFLLAGLVVGGLVVVQRRFAGGRP